MAAYGYTRVSTDEQALEGQSLDAQERALEAMCARAGVTLTRMFVDAGVSARTPLRERPAGRQLMEALKRGDQVFAT